MNNETFLGVVVGKEIFCNLNDEASINETLNYLESLTEEKWCTFKERTGVANRVFYRESMFEVKDRYLHFKDTSATVELPLNCSSCQYMFSYCDLPTGFTLGDNFDTFNVRNMSSMFLECAIPEGFSLGDKFSTSCVEDMTNMFCKCIIPEGFSLGNNFDTSKVVWMDGMFALCTMPNGFSLGDKFDTSRVEKMTGMFKDCIFPDGFTLGDNFDTSSVKTMQNMFWGCKMSDSFSLGERFSVPNDIYSRTMFFEAILPRGKSENDFQSHKDIIKWLKGSRFDKKEYLLQCLDILPMASVEACVTKEDCDALLERLGLK